MQVARAQARTAAELASIDERTRRSDERLERLEAQSQVLVAQPTQDPPLLAAREGLAIEVQRESLKNRAAVGAWVRSLLNDKIATAITGAVIAFLTGLGAWITSLLDRSNGH